MAFLLALGARLTFALGYWVDKPLTLDEQEYLTLGKNLAAGRGLVYEADGREHFGRAPGYPAFLAVVFALGGGTKAYKVAQSLIGALTVLAIAVLARLAAGPRAEVLAAFMAALYPPLVWIAAYPLSEALFSALELASGLLLWIALRRERTSRNSAYAVAGVVAGLAALVAVVSRSWWKKEKASSSGELIHNSRPLGSGCRRMTPWRSDSRSWSERRSGGVRSGLDRARDARADSGDDRGRSSMRSWRRALGAAPVAAGRRGAQRATATASELRTLTTSLGPTTIAMPRARIEDDDGRRREWRSRIIAALPATHRAGRRGDPRSVPERHQHAAAARSAGAAAARGAVVEGRGVAPGGAAARGLRDVGAARPAAGARFATCSSTAGTRECGSARSACGCRCWSRSACAPTASGWCSTCGWPAKRARRRGREVLRIRWSRATSALPALAVIDGNPGLDAALRAPWPQLADPALHQPQAVEPAGQGPGASARGARRGLPADDLRRRAAEAVEKARDAFVRKWKLRCNAVLRQLRGGRRRSVHLPALPASQWKALRTTNALERINEEFRRRTKTQASLPERGRGAVAALRTSAQRPDRRCAASSAGRT